MSCALLKAYILTCMCLQNGGEWYLTARGICRSCNFETKYICIKCKVYCCTRCSEPECDEETPGWKAGKSVGYCEDCSLRILDEDSDESQSYLGKQGIEKKIKRLKQLANSTASDEEDEDCKVEEKKGKEKKKPGRKSNWSSETIDDFIDIVVNDDYYKKKLVFTNTKNQKNGEIYEKILSVLKERATKRGEVINFTVAQLRNKFKKCVSECKQAALTIKTATGIKRFQEERGFGNWFNALFALVKSRDSCKPELALEPSSLSLDQQSTEATTDENSKDKLFIPIKKKPKLKPLEKLTETAAEAMNVVKETLKNDPTKDLIAFMREEMDKSREHELKLVGIMQSFRQSNMPFQSPPQFQSVPGMPCGEGSLLSTTNYPTWNIAIGSPNQPTAAACQNPQVVCSRTTEAESGSFHHDGNRLYQKL